MPVNPNPPFNNMNFISQGWTDLGSGFLTPVNAPTSGGVLAEGSAALQLGQDFVDITFPSALADTNYALSRESVENTVDTDPPKIFVVNVVSKTQLGMRILLNAIPITENYTLQWAITEKAS